MAIPEKEKGVEAELQGYEGSSISQVFDAQADSLPSTLATNKIRKSALVEELKARLGL